MRWTLRKNNSHYFVYDVEPSYELLSFSRLINIECLRQCFVGLLEDNTSFEGEGQTESQRTRGGWSYLNWIIVSFWLDIWFNIFMLLCPVAHLTTNINCTLLWVSIEMVFMNSWNEYVEVARIDLLIHFHWICIYILDSFHHKEIL